jgi:hypothetical protein
MNADIDAGDLTQANCRLHETSSIVVTSTRTFDKLAEFRKNPI